jgi:hypothetical protein
VSAGIEPAPHGAQAGALGNLTPLFATTNAIENCLGTVQRVSRNVKRWKGGTMVRRSSPKRPSKHRGPFRAKGGHGEAVDIKARSQMFNRRRCADSQQRAGHRRTNRTNG